MTAEQLIKKASAVVTDADTAKTLLSSLPEELATDLDLARAVDFCQGFAEELARVDAIFADDIKAADKAHKELTGAKKKVIKAVDEADFAVRNRIRAFFANRPAEAKRAELPSGLSVREDKVPVVEDIQALLKAVMSGKVPTSVLGVDTKALKDVAKTGLAIPGVKVETSCIVTIRRAAE